MKATTVIRIALLALYIVARITGRGLLLVVALLGLVVLVIGGLINGRGKSWKVRTINGRRHLVIATR